LDLEIKACAEKTASFSDNNRGRVGTALWRSFGYQQQMPWIFAHEAQVLNAAELK
jgi:hypothetical protein